MLELICPVPVRRLARPSKSVHLSDVSKTTKTPSDQVTRNALAARNNETWGLGKKTSETLEDKLKNIYKYYFDKLETSREVILIYKELKEDEINVVNKGQTWDT